MSFTWKAPKDIFKGEGIYHVTWNVAGKQRLLGHLEALPTDSTCAHVAHSELGFAVSEDLSVLSHRYPGVQLIAKMVMDNHIHAILYVTENATRHVRQIAYGFQQGITNIAEKMGVWQSRPTNPPTHEQTPRQPTHEQAPRLSIPEQGIPQSTPEQAPSPVPRQLILEPAFIRTLVHRGQLRTMIDYVHNNPTAAYQRRLHPELYTLRRRVEHSGFLFDTMGKARLLEWPDKQVIALPRTLPQPLIDEEIRKALYLASLGAVTLTGAMSEGEKKVARAIREAGFPLVVMLLDGFPPEGSPHAPYYHPGGAYHQACGQGLLYLMEPHLSCYDNPTLIEATEAELRRKADIKHLIYTPIPHNSKRWRMIAANQLLQML